MKPDDLRKIAGKLERASHHDGPFSLKTRQGWWLFAISLDDLSRQLEDEEKARGESINWGHGEMVWDGEVPPPDFSRGAPTREGEALTTEALRDFGKRLREDWENLPPDPFANDERPAEPSRPSWSWPWHRTKAS